MVAPTAMMGALAPRRVRAVEAPRWPAEALKVTRRAAKAVGATEHAMAGT